MTISATRPGARRKKRPPQPITDPFARRSQERSALGVLLFLGLLTHLVGLSHPRQVVFDEVHWGKFITAYCCTGARFFDLHPPHAKLLLALGAKLAGYAGGFSFETIGQPYLDVPVFGLRLLPALVGVTIPILLYRLLRLLGASLPAALFGGLCLLFDNAMLLETHVLNLDGILVAATLGSLVCLLEFHRAPSPARRWVLVAGSGALAGLALGTKFNGLAALGLILIIVSVRVVTRVDPMGRAIRVLCVAGAAAALVYLGGWAIHFALLPNPGPGDAFYPTTGRFLDDLRVVHETMWRENVNLVQTHVDASRPWTWPFMKVAPFFWVSDDASIYFVGNPIVWWGSGLLFVVLLVNHLLMKVTGLRMQTAAVARGRSEAWIPLIGYAISYLPFFGVTRVLFLYHYLVPLTFAVTYVVLWLDRAGWVRSDDLRGQRRSYYAALASVVIAFLLVSPVTYGFSVGRYDEWLAGFIRSWR